MWVSVTMAWHTLMLWMEEMASRVAANILNKQSQTADKGCSHSFGVGERKATCYKKSACYEMLHRTSELDSLE